MPDIHLDAAGSNTAPYGTWATAATTIATAAGAEAAGDRILMGSAFSASVAGITAAFAGTPARPVQVLSGTKDVTSGLTALAEGAVWETTNVTYSLTGSAYFFGITHRITSNSSTVPLIGTNDGDCQTHESCSFISTGTSANTYFRFGHSTGYGQSRTHLINCKFRVGAAAQHMSYGGDVFVQGGTWLSGGTAPNFCFRVEFAARGSRLVVEGLDLTNVATTTRLHGQGGGGSTAIFRDILLPASWTGGPISDADLTHGLRVELWNYRVGPSTWNRFWIRDRQVTLTAETTIVRNGKGSDDQGAYSVRMATTANCSILALARTMDFVVPNTVTGTNITVTAQIVRDSATALTDAEVWLEVEEPDGTITRDSVADVLATPANQASSGVAWTTTGLTSPNTQALAVTINASRAGPLLCRVVCARPSTTIFVCQQVEVT